MITGLPIHQSIATIKPSSACVTTLATARFIRNRLVNFRLAIPSVLAAVMGSSIGAHLSMATDEKIMRYILFIILPVSALIVLNKKLFHDAEDDTVRLNRRTVLTAIGAAFTIGIYDGFYGPGTGTFLIIEFTVLARMSIQTANAQAKVINLTTNITSLVIFLLNGQVLIPLGLAAAVCNMAGGYIGAGLVMPKGSKIVKPIILFVLGLLLIKILQ